MAAKRRKRLLDRLQAAQDLLRRRDADVVFREIDAGFEQRDQFQQLLLDRTDAPRNRAFHLLRRDASLVQRGGFNQIADRFGLRQIDSSVEICPQRELARLGQPGAGRASPLESRIEEPRAIRGRRFRPDLRRCRSAARRRYVSDHLIDDVAFVIDQLGQRGSPGLPLMIRAKTQNLRSDRARVGAGKPHHPDAGPSGRSGNCDDRVANLQCGYGLPTCRDRRRHVAEDHRAYRRGLPPPPGRLSRSRGPSRGGMGRGGRIGSGSGISIGSTTTCRNGPVPGAFAADIRFVAQAQVDDAPLAAVHRIEVERPARLLHLFGGGHGAQAQLLNPQHPIIVGVEAQQRMMLGRHAQRFHGQKLQRQQQFRFVGQQQIHVRAGELHQQIGIFQIGMQMLAFQDFVFDIQVHDGRTPCPEILRCCGPVEIDGVLLFVHVAQPLDLLLRQRSWALRPAAAWA